MPLYGAEISIILLHRGFNKVHVPLCQYRYNKWAASQGKNFIAYTNSKSLGDFRSDALAVCQAYLGLPVGFLLPRYSV